MGFRRTRLGAMGEAFDVFNYRVEMDFAATDTGANQDGSTFIYGPFSVQTEWFDTWVDRSAAADMQFDF